jgi:ABC-type multidrug transport system fused ATPase/permease subunit
MKKLMKDRTVLLISHRLIGMEEMDEILVVSGGRIIERGRHDELLDAEGLYRRMLTYRQQMLHFGTALPGS